MTKEKKKKKKINKLSLKEIEKKLDETKKMQGGILSKYAQSLIRRKKEIVRK